jgi:hypothetical protein
MKMKERKRKKQERQQRRGRRGDERGSRRERKREKVGGRWVSCVLFVQVEASSWLHMFVLASECLSALLLSHLGRTVRGGACDRSEGDELEYQSEGR